MDRGIFYSPVSRITGLSPRQLSYWRKTGLLFPAMQTSGGHARFSFVGLVSLNTASRLIDAGVSVQRIRQCLQSLSRFLPNSNTRLQELSLVATGDVVLVLRSDDAFDALTEQEWIFHVADLEREALPLLTNSEAPRQGKLFSDPDGPNLENINRLSQG